MIVDFLQKVDIPLPFLTEAQAYVGAECAIRVPLQITFLTMIGEFTQDMVSFYSANVVNRVTGSIYI